MVRRLKTRLFGCVSSVLPPKFPGPAGGGVGIANWGGSVRERGGRFSKPHTSGCFRMYVGLSVKKSRVRGRTPKRNHETRCTLKLIRAGPRGA
jgi:hypothetical protein